MYCTSPSGGSALQKLTAMRERDSYAGLQALPPDPEEKSMAGTVLACTLVAIMTLGGCSLVCVLLDEEAAAHAPEN